MKIFLLSVLILIGLFGISLADTTPQAKITTYTAPTGEAACMEIPAGQDGKRTIFEPWSWVLKSVESDVVEPNSYRVFVNGKKLDIYRASSPLFEGEEYYYTYFDFDGKVDVRVESGASLAKAELFPDFFGGLRKSGDNVAEFSADKPFKTVFIRNKRQMPLVIIGNGIEKKRPSKTDKNVIWFGAGVHVIDEPIILRDNQTMYVEGGAVVKASIYAKGKNIKICGRGIISGGRFPKFSRGFTYFEDCENLTIEDVIFTEPNHWIIVLQNCKNVDIRGINICGSRILNDDAIDICDSCDVRISNVFSRTQDDSIAIKGMFFKNPTERIFVNDCIFWTDKANIYRIGYECNTSAIRDIHSKNIYVPFYSKDFRPADHLWANCVIYLQPSSEIPMSNITFENIVVRSDGSDNVMILLSPTLVDYGGARKAWSEVVPPKKPGSLSDCSIKNFRVVGETKNGNGVKFTGPIRINGKGPESYVKNVVMENINYFGEKITKDSPNVEIGKDFVENIEIK